MTETKHTPTPWHIECEPFNVWDQRGDLIARVNAPMSMKEPDDPWDRGCANAAFIVRACNEHDDLVAQRDALRAAWTMFFERLDDIERDGSERAKTLLNDLVNGSLGEAIESGRHAIAEAKVPFVLQPWQRAALAKPTKVTPEKEKP